MFWNVTASRRTEEFGRSPDILFAYIGGVAQSEPGDFSNGGEVSVCVFSSVMLVKDTRKVIFRGASCSCLQSKEEAVRQRSGPIFQRGRVLDLNEVYTSNGIRGMLAGKDFEALDMVFPIDGSFVD